MKLYYGSLSGHSHRVGRRVVRDSVCSIRSYHHVTISLVPTNLVSRFTRKEQK
jgi:hypothetical protein